MPVQARDDHCLTADDVRRAAEAVARRRREFSVVSATTVADEQKKLTSESPNRNLSIASSPSIAADVTATFGMVASFECEEKKNPTVRDIQRAVCRACNTSLEEMISTRRDKSAVLPRQIAMMLAKLLTTASLPEIGRKFNRDHTTVMHAMNKMAPVVAEVKPLVGNAKLGELIAFAWDAYWRLKPKSPRRGKQSAY